MPSQLISRHAVPLFSSVRERSISPHHLFNALSFPSERVIQTVSAITNVAWSAISNLLAAGLGLILSLLSWIPLPRLTQWCPPMIPIFDGLIALTIGIILYVLALWILVAYFGSVIPHHLYSKSLTTTSIIPYSGVVIACS